MSKIKKVALRKVIDWRGFSVMAAAIFLTIIWVSAAIIIFWFSLPTSSKIIHQVNVVGQEEAVKNGSQPAVDNKDQIVNQIKASVYFIVPVDQKNFEPLSFTAAPDGRSFAYVLKNGNQASVVLNGQAGPLYDAVTFMIFSPDGRRFAYGVKINGQEKIVLDGLAGQTYDWTFAPRSFTPDSRYFIYKARNSQGDRMVVNNTWASQAYERIYEPVLTNDQSQLIYYGLTDNKIWRTAISLDKTTK